MTDTTSIATPSRRSDRRDSEPIMADMESVEFAIAGVQRVLAGSNKYDEVCCVLYTLDWVLHNAPRMFMMPPIMELVRSLVEICDGWVVTHGVSEDGLVIMEKVLLLKWAVVRLRGGRG